MSFSTHGNQKRNHKQKRDRSEYNDNSQKASARSQLKEDENTLVRLSKRMSELDMASRREADRFIVAGRVVVGGTSVQPTLGQKVSSDETDIVLLKNRPRDDGEPEPDNVLRRPGEFDWAELQTAAVVLHKPVGCVSGQPDQDKHHELHTPAVRLLTRSNAHIHRQTYSTKDEYHQAQILVQERLRFELHHRMAVEETLYDYVPAGRLDLESTGLLIFTNHGVLAKKLVSAQGLLDKEYVVLVEPLSNLTRDERARGITSLPKPNRNLGLIRKGGFRLFGEETRPLRPAVEAEWLDWTDSRTRYFQESNNDNPRQRVLRLVLREGRKHHVRRMCREILGVHVLQLVRTRVGPVDLLVDHLPAGAWRPLRMEEAKAIYLA